jgi:hypothetical protein
MGIYLKCRCFVVVMYYCCSVILYNATKCILLNVCYYVFVCIHVFDCILLFKVCRFLSIRAICYMSVFSIEFECSVSKT